MADLKVLETTAATASRAPRERRVVRRHARRRDGAPRPEPRWILCLRRAEGVWCLLRSNTRLAWMALPHAVCAGSWMISRTGHLLAWSFIVARRSPDHQKMSYWFLLSISFPNAA